VESLSRYIKSLEKAQEAIVVREAHSLKQLEPKEER
jgi:hypothetical protein